MEYVERNREQRPWLSQYGDHIDEMLDTPAHPNLVAAVVAAADEFSGDIAFTTVMPNGMYGSLTYDQVDEMSDAFAVYLREVVGLDDGDRVALQMPNCLSYPVTMLGVLKAGCVVVNTNPMYTTEEMKHQFDDSGARAVVIVDLFADKLEEIIDDTPVEHVVTMRVPEFFPPIVKQITYGVMKYWNRQVPGHSMEATRLPQALEQGRDRGVDTGPCEYWQEKTHDDLALLQYTGGTTGVAKGAMLSHGNLLWNLAQIQAMTSSHLQRGQEVVLTALPLYHIFACSVNFFDHVSGGGSQYLGAQPTADSAGAAGDGKLRHHLADRGQYAVQCIAQ